MRARRRPRRRLAGPFDTPGTGGAAAVGCCRLAPPLTPAASLRRKRKETRLAAVRGGRPPPPPVAIALPSLRRSGLSLAVPSYPVGGVCSVPGAAPYNGCLQSRPGDQVAGHSASVAPLSPTKLAANGTVSAPRDEGLRTRGNAVEMKKAAGFFLASPSLAVEPCLSNLCSSTLWQWKLPAVWALGVFGEVGAQTASIVAVHGCRPALASPG
jgi:hypothetical protein